MTEKVQSPGKNGPKPSNRLHPRLLAATRFAVAAVWIYEGLWLKMLHPAPHELAVMTSVTLGPFPPDRLLSGIGCGEVLLGLGVLSGWYARLLAWVQAMVLILMNGIGIAFAGKAISNPVGLVIHNLPFLLCIIIVGSCGNGSSAPRRASGQS